MSCERISPSPPICFKRNNDIQYLEKSKIPYPHLYPHLVLSFFISLALVNCTTTSKQLTKTPESFESKASAYLSEYESACRSENGATWSKSLCVPMIIIDRDSLVAVTNRPDHEGKFKKINDVFVGRYSGPTIYANTSILWKGVRWSMVLWPLPEEKVDRLQLLLHEAFHSVQNEIGLPMNNAMNEHLDQEEARVLIRLEWNALMSALEDKPQQSKHIANALWYRQQRFKKFPSARDNEQDLEMSEGLAEYTGTKLSGRSPDETVIYLKKRLDSIPQVFSLARSSAYYSGPLYGIILDSQKNTQDWRSEITSIKSFNKLFNKTQIAAPKVQDEKKYQKRSIVSFEKKRAGERSTKVAAYLKKIKQPGQLKLEFKDQPQMTFNPYGIIPISKDEVLYTTCEIMAEWGKLTVNDGAILKRDKVLSSLTLSPVSKTSDSSAAENDWSLSLNSGWVLQKNKDSARIVKKD